MATPYTYLNLLGISRVPQFSPLTAGSTLDTRAKKRPIEVVTPEAFGVDVAPQLRTLEVNAPASRAAGTKVADVAELVHRLRNEAKVI